jgi:hypothetical protein
MAVTNSADQPADNSESPSRSPEERRTRLLIMIGAVLLFGGIALAVTDDETGRWLIVGGVAVLFTGLHRFGRLGPENLAT